MAEFLTMFTAGVIDPRNFFLNIAWKVESFYMFNKTEVRKSCCTDKKENKIFPRYQEIQKERLKSHIWLTDSSYSIWLNNFAFPHILGSHSLYMTLQPLPYEFPYMRGKCYFLFSTVPLKRMLGFVKRRAMALSRLLACVHTHTRPFSIGRSTRPLRSHRPRLARASCCQFPAR